MGTTVQGSFEITKGPATGTYQVHTDTPSLGAWTLPVRARRISTYLKHVDEAKIVFYNGILRKWVIRMKTCRYVCYQSVETYPYPPGVSTDIRIISKMPFVPTPAYLRQDPNAKPITIEYIVQDDDKNDAPNETEAPSPSPRGRKSSSPRRRKRSPSPAAPPADDKDGSDEKEGSPPSPQEPSPSSVAAANETQARRPIQTMIPDKDTDEPPQRLGLRRDE